VQPSGFYAWQKNPLSQRAREDARQTDLIRQAWNDSGKVHGYRKLHDDLLDQGETCCPNRVAPVNRARGYQGTGRIWYAPPQWNIKRTLTRFEMMESWCDGQSDNGRGRATAVWLVRGLGGLHRLS
jgi:hypothetical protein